MQTQTQKEKETQHTNTTVQTSQNNLTQHDNDRSSCVVYRRHNGNDSANRFYVHEKENR